MNDLYDSDILTWSEQQAALLRRKAALGFQESMRRRLDTDRIYRWARHRFARQLDGVDPNAPLPDTFPFMLDELLAEP